MQIGTTEKIAMVFLHLAQRMLAKKMFQPLLRFYETLIPSLFAILAFSHTCRGSFSIIEFFLIGAPCHTELFQKITNYIFLDLQQEKIDQQLK